MVLGDVMAATCHCACCKWQMLRSCTETRAFFFETHLNKICPVVQATEMLEHSEKCQYLKALLSHGPGTDFEELLAALSLVRNVLLCDCYSQADLSLLHASQLQIPALCFVGVLAGP